MMPYPGLALMSSRNRFQPSQVVGSGTGPGRNAAGAGSRVPGAGLVSGLLAATIGRGDWLRGGSAVSLRPMRTAMLHFFRSAPGFEDRQDLRPVGTQRIVRSLRLPQDQDSILIKHAIRSGLSVLLL